MIRIKVEVKDKIKNDSWHEELDVSSPETAEKEVREIIQEFNDTLKPNENPREFVRIIKDAPQKALHDIYKRNLVTQCDKEGMYDEWKCTTCGLTWRTYRINAHESLFKKECHPERTCGLCNRIFKTEISYKRHHDKKHKSRTE